MLFNYAEDVQRFLRDSRQQDIDLADIYKHVNTARREVAMRAQCIRRLTPISGQVVTASVTSAGHGYTNPSVTISGPDFPSGQGNFPNGSQATALPILQGGSISSVDIQYGGDGYFQPSATITDVGGVGTGAAATLTTSPINTLTQGKEKYDFADIDVSMFPGVAQVYWINSVAIIYANWRYSPEYCSFSKYQALVRTFTPNTYQFYPSYYTQYGRGTDGSFFFYPVPALTIQAEYDCLCLPSDLLTDDSEETIPNPWRDAVKYMAAHFCYLDLQNFNKAREYLGLFDQYMTRYGAYAQPGQRQNQYGRPLR